ncbi:MAG: NAD(P)/FAD-dependent oxidoreductase [Lachnospiraceae bacterium]|nr:NAD(P)/FAD-dependent oxidoreductase [Lachnospiraceae bacterium]
MIKLSGIKLLPGESEELLEKKIRSCLKTRADFEYHIIKKSLDARKKPEISYVYSLSVKLNEKEEKRLLKNSSVKNISPYSRVLYEPRLLKPSEKSLGQELRPVIVGFGPCGIFCAYVLTLAGLKPLVIERGLRIDERAREVEAFWEGKELDSECNVAFGEGGAGAFSDGKLNTGVKDREGFGGFILDTFVKYGADRELSYMAKPHIGTDRLRDIIRNLRSDMEKMGCSFMFDTALRELLIEEGRIRGIKTSRGEIKSNKVVLAIGHSARDTFLMLRDKGLNMTSKPFAVGFRLEHAQSLLNESQYGRGHDKSLPAADYKVTNKSKKGKMVYSFCMCPGGYVVDSSSQAGQLCINGMSYSGRDGKNCNSAIVVAVDEKDYGYSEDPLKGMYYQEDLEKKAFDLCGGKIPLQTLGAFKEGRVNTEDEFKLSPCIKGSYERADLTGILSREQNEAIIESIEKWNESIKGFSDPFSLLSAVESRTSSPVRILRDEYLESNIRGVYPAGEGAGYAGGIMSAAMDGIRIAERILDSIRLSAPLQES